MNKIERLFNGCNSLEESLISILNGQIDKILSAAYDSDKANTPLSCVDKEGGKN
ncbi:hypothetical protein [Aneurinibacillus danicus]|uniref:Uncharacterized protein n=1 Tax=Aneurinibacillus danicus TaxID=267746 RepID=A0A511VFF0_9BACL|nr:hypothetical protein [Aneurinibacillus danicus]GEN35962.1 hypothetical protein ADA01nite_34220 [Aneurinibacillus danicus]